MKNLNRASLTAVAAAALLTLGACGGSTNKPITAGDPVAAATTTPAPSIAPDAKTGKVDVCANNDPSTTKISGELAATFTVEEVSAATCVMLEMQYQIGWTNLAIPNDDALKASKGQAVVELLRPWMTTFGLKTANGLAVKAAAGDQDGIEGLTGLTEIAVTNSEWDLRAVKDPTSPIVGDRKWSDSIITLDAAKGEDGGPLLDIAIVFTDQMLSRKTDGALGSVPVTHEITYGMSQTSLKDHPFLVDRWDASWEYGTPTLDKTEG